MPRTFSSREERTAKLHAIINGQSTSRRRTTSKPFAGKNLLLGVMLHAAARHSKGKTLSPLEARLVDSLQQFADDDIEVAQYGAIFTEAKQQMRASTASANFPQAVLDLEEDDAYTSDALYRDVVALAPEIVAQPNHQIVDLARARGGPVDSEEYLSALKEAGGSGVTLFTASDLLPDFEERETVLPEGLARGLAEKIVVEKEEKVSIPVEGAQPASTPSLPYRLILEKFECLKSTGDSMFSPRQEIYWAFASGADSTAQNSQKTPEYGSVETGTVKVFDYPTVLFEGTVHEDVTGHVECWEADDSDDAWYDGLRKTMRDISRYCVDAAVEARKTGAVGSSSGSITKTQAVLALAALAFEALSVLLELIRNDDDFVARRDFGWTRAGLQWLLNQPDHNTSMIFEGGEGKYELWIKREHVPLPNIGPLRVTTGTGSSWSPAVDVGGQWSVRSMSMVECLGNLYGIYAYQGTRQLVITKRKADGCWDQPTRITRHYAQSRPAPATFGDGDLGIAYRDNEDHLRFIRTNLRNSNALDNWEDPVYIPSTTTVTLDGPALADYRGRLYAVHRSINGTELYCASSDSGGRSWGGNQKCNNYLALSRPELCVEGTDLFLAYLSIGCIAVDRYTGNANNHSWQHIKEIKLWAFSAISMTVYDGAKWFAYRASDGTGTIKLLKMTGTADTVSYATNASAVQDPEICAFDGKLCLSYADPFS